jgi:hypothetical protein
LLFIIIFRDGDRVTLQYNLPPLVQYSNEEFGVFIQYQMQQLPLAPPTQDQLSRLVAESGCLPRLVKFFLEAPSHYDFDNAIAHLAKMADEYYHEKVYIAILTHPLLFFLSLCYSIGILSSL